MDGARCSILKKKAVDIHEKCWRNAGIEMQHSTHSQMLSQLANCTVIVGDEKWKQINWKYIM